MEGTRQLRALALLALGLFAAIGNSRAQSPARPDRAADAIYINANVYTMDASRPRAEAIAVEGNRVLDAGSAREVMRWSGAKTSIIDLGGATVLPGLIDAHGHVAGLGSFGLGRIDLSGARSFDDVIASVVSSAKKAKMGEWVLGGRWDHESWPSKQLPQHTDLSAATPDNPVWLRRVDGHAGLANAAAMRLAGITRDTPSPPGGEVIKDARGEPTGVFVDNATALIERHISAPDVGGEALILKAQEMLLAAGLTGVHDAGVSPAEIDVYKGLAADGRLKIRVYAMVSGPYAMRYFEEHPVLIGDRLTVRAAKMYIDGAMGSRGAWLLEPYADRPVGPDGKPYTGLAVSDPQLLLAVAKHGVEKGYQVCTHAIGDRGNRETLDAYEAALSPASNRADHAPAASRRFRVEHAQLLAPSDILRFALLGIIPSMQPTHCTSDMRWVDARVGPERAKGAYAWASLLKTGAVIAAGSDFPVESHNPFLGLYAAVTRQDDHSQPPGGWHPEQRITREEALRAYTLGAAYAAFEEKDKGSLQPGKLADFIVIDRDVMTCEPIEIPGTRVLRTVIGGETVYSRDNLGK
jgi:predicted amidohydrolase YtcJ